MQTLQSSQPSGAVTLSTPADSFDWWSDSSLALSGSLGCWVIDIDNAPSVNLLTPTPAPFAGGDAQLQQLEVQAHTQRFEIVLYLPALIELAWKSTHKVAQRSLYNPLRVKGKQTAVF